MILPFQYFSRLAELNEEMRASDYAGGDDDTFNDVVHEFSQVLKRFILLWGVGGGWVFTEISHDFFSFFSISSDFIVLEVKVLFKGLIRLYNTPPFRVISLFQA